jgi:hypothetical protein
MHNLVGDLRCPIDARRLTMAAKNPSCIRLSTIIIAGLEPNAVTQQVFGLPNNSEQSAFALRHGTTFERVQCRNSAARLLQALQQAGILDKEDGRVLDLGQLPNSNPSSSVARIRAAQPRIAETERALRAKAGRSVDAPNVILQPHLRLPLGDGEEPSVRPDLLVARSGEARYRVGEIKSAPALRHLTDEQDIANAAAQCGVYAVALAASLRRLGLSAAVPSEAVLVLRKPGSFNGVATLQRIDRDIEAARRVLARHPDTLHAITEILGPDQTLDTAANVLRLPAKFSGNCRSFCSLWQVCRKESRSHSAPAVLGADAEELLGPLGNTQRARELMAGAIPSNELERDIQRRLAVYRKELGEAAG